MKLKQAGNGGGGTELQIELLVMLSSFPSYHYVSFLQYTSSFPKRYWIEGSCQKQIKDDDLGVLEMKNHHGAH